MACVSFDGAASGELSEDEQVEVLGEGVGELGDEDVQRIADSAEVAELEA